MTLDDDSAILTLPPSPPESLAPGNLGLSPSSSPPLNSPRLRAWPPEPPDSEAPEIRDQAA